MAMLQKKLNEPEVIADSENELIEAEVIAGLSQVPKCISPKYFYDQQGSELFDAITELDEYYIPRVERQIFLEYCTEICSVLGESVTLVEPGAGSCEKVRWLLQELKPAAYVPMDISAEHLYASAADLSNEYPDLSIVPKVCDHTQGLDLQLAKDASPAVFFYPGSSVGNFEPAAAVAFLRSIRAQISEGGGLLIGVDAKKDQRVLHDAYNDKEGVTARFNVNVLSNLNNLLGGTIDSAKFEHHALYNEAHGRIEMHLRCTEAHAAELAGKRVEFAENELVHTENSYKYHPEEFVALAERAGFAHEKLWQDKQGWFSVMYFSPA